MPDPTTFSRSGEFVLRTVGTEAILVPIRNRVGDLDSIYVMTPVAVRVWELLDGVRNAGDIAEIIAGEYEVSADTAQRDVTDLLQALQDAGLIRTV